MSLLLKRKSIRNYTSKEISDEVLKKLLISAMQAPSACNQQPWEFVVIDDHELLLKLSKTSKGAWMLENVQKAIAVVLIPTEKAPTMAPQDCAAATQNILLEATNNGLGACWIGIYSKQDREDYVNQLLQVKDGKTVFSLISLGYPNKQEEITIRFDENRIVKNTY